jgi:MoaA/NifB/PqqE/SkfB family radical SAM enzyme
VPARPVTFVHRAQRWLDVRSRSGLCLRAPETIVLGVNNSCNLHCSMCDVGTGASDTNFARSLIGTRPMNMPLELLQKIISDAAAFSPPPEIGFAFTEPGIYPHLGAGIRRASRAGLFTSLTTNGWTLERRAGELVAAGLDLLCVSLDGPPVIHDRIRGKVGSFSAAVAGIRAVRRLRPVETRVFCAVTADNAGHLVALLDALRAVPIDSLTIMHTNFVTPEMVGRHQPRFGGSYPATLSSMAGFDPGALDLEILAEQLQRLRAAQADFSVAIQPEISAWPELRRYYQDPAVPIGRRCVDPFQYLMVKSNGDVIAAHGRCYNVTVGNCHRAGLSGIWNSEPFADFRRTLVEAGGLLPACTRCCGGFAP